MITTISKTKCSRCDKKTNPKHRRNFILLSALCSILVAGSPPANAAVVTAKKSDDFVDSIGINIKLDRNVYNNNWSQVKSRFQELGIWQYRDGLKLVNNSSTYRNRFQQLYNESGAKGLFVWGPWENQGKPGNQAVGAAKKGLDYVRIISGPNEPDLFWENNYDNNSSTNIWQEVRNYQNSMYDALKADSATDHIVVTTPPLSTYTKADDLGNAGNIKCDRIAWHFYTGQGHPDKSEIGTGITQTKNGLGKSSFPNSDMFTTEAGHNSWKTANPGNSNNSSVNEVTQMRYNVRILAEHFRRGIKRTYLHQLMDLGTNPSQFNNSWGIVKADGNKTPKPAFTAIKNIVSLFKERSWNSSSKTWNNPSFTPGSLDYSITGSTDSVRSVLLQKSNGTFYMLVWVAADSWNESNDTNKTVTRSINIVFANAQTVTRENFDNSGNLVSASISSSNGNKTWSLTASTTLSILEITSGGAGSSFTRFSHKPSSYSFGWNSSWGHDNIRAGSWTGDNVKWKEIAVTSTWFRLEHKPSGRWLGWNTAWGSDRPRMGFNTWTGDNTQWRRIDVGGGFHRIQHKPTGHWIGFNTAWSNDYVRMGPQTWTGNNTQWDSINTP
ncbi:MAG: hypothetical protein AAF558_02655 [Verrucomicrobiota bacterium]